MSQKKVKEKKKKDSNMQNGMDLLAEIQGHKNNFERVNKKDAKIIVAGGELYDSLKNMSNDGYLAGMELRQGNIDNKSFQIGG